MLYGAFANVMCALDGKKSLARAIAEAEAETGCEKSEGAVKKYIDAMNHLADWGYLEAVARPELTGAVVRRRRFLRTMAARRARFDVRCHDRRAVHGLAFAYSDGRVSAVHAAIGPDCDRCHGIRLG